MSKIIRINNSLLVGFLLIFLSGTFFMFGCSSAYDNGATTKTTSTFPTSMAGFNAKDLDGNAIDDSIFTQKDITIVNFWATYCGPCINEMPSLQSWAENMPSNMQILGVITDIDDKDSDSIDSAKTIIKQTGVKYQNVISQGQLSKFTNKLVGVPTTFFVDKSGNVLGEEIVGAQVEQYKRKAQELLASIQK